MLVLQGERDYQVTMEDFAKWKAALGARSDVTLKSYPTLQSTSSSPARDPSVSGEYMTPGHVAEEALRDIAAWVATVELP